MYADSPQLQQQTLPQQNNMSSKELASQQYGIVAHQTSLGSQLQSKTQQYMAQHSLNQNKPPISGGTSQQYNQMPLGNIEQGIIPQSMTPGQGLSTPNKNQQSNQQSPVLQSKSKQLNGGIMQSRSRDPSTLATGGNASIVQKSFAMKQGQYDQHMASRNQGLTGGYGQTTGAIGLMQTQKIPGQPQQQTSKGKVFMTSQQLGPKFPPTQQQQHIPMPMNYGLPNFQNSKISHKSFGSVKSFSANTNVGLIRQYNEDRIAIILNVIHPVNKTPAITNWPNIQIFGIYDGHGGSKCAEYLKDNLHNSIINLPEFPADINKAITKGSKQCDENFLNMLYDEYKQKFAETKQKMASINRAGSCALMIMTVDEDLYVINVGDSRAIMSKNMGEEYKSMTNDHKPMDPGEYQRIVSNGGRIYQSQTVFKGNNPTPMIQQVTIDQLLSAAEQDTNNPYVGPYRVAPGRLSVSRTFGDIEAKHPDLGGMPGVVVCDPEITYMKNGGLDVDFIVLGSDGIFDKLSTEEICQLVWNIIKENQYDPAMSLHQICGKCADEILRFAAKQKTMDNISIVMIGFKKLQDYLERCRQTSGGVSQNSIKQGVYASSNSGLSGVEGSMAHLKQHNEKIEQIKSQTQKVEGIYKSLGQGATPNINESTLRLDQIRQASRAAAAKEFESNRHSRNLPPYQNMSNQAPYMNSNQSIDSSATQQLRSTMESQGTWKGKIGKIRARNTGLSSNQSNTNSSNSRDRTKGANSSLGSSMNGGLVLPPMVNNQKQQYYQDAQQLKQSSFLPANNNPQIGSSSNESGSLERRYIPTSSSTGGGPGISANRPSQQHLINTTLTQQNTYFPPQQPLPSQGYSSVPAATSGKQQSHLSDRKQSFDNAQQQQVPASRATGYSALLSLNREQTNTSQVPPRSNNNNNIIKHNQSGLM